ncbi:MAG: helix-turn-helix domain-containing protein [Leptospiraceae bacterium]|nr:helix-turn-helix domain-containing protein [Leptospiraceae bacterium]
MDFLVDEPSTENCASIGMRKDWRPAGNLLNLGFSPSDIWIRLQDIEPGPKFLMFQQPMIGEVLQCGPARNRAGVDVPVQEWPYKVRYPTFRLDGGSGPHFFRLRSRKVINFPVELLGLSELLRHIQIRQLVQFSLLAGAGIAALFFLAVYLYSFRRLYLLFSLALLSTSFSLFVVYGDGYLYLWPASPTIQKAMFKSTSMLAAMFASLFVRSLLQTWQWLWLDRIILLAISLQALAAFSSLWPALDSFFFVVLVAGPIFGIVLTLPVAIIRLREGDIPTRFYFLGWAVLLFAFLFNILVFRGVLDYQGWMAYSPIFAAPITFAFLGMGSYSRLQSEKRKRFLLQERNRLLSQQLEQARRSMEERKERPGSASKPDQVAEGGMDTEPAKEEEQIRQATPVRSQLAGVDIEAKEALLLQSMEEDKLYEVEDLRLEALARHVDLRPHQLSELLNQILNTSFSDFLRKFRIDAAMKKLADPDCQDSILDIGLAVGFGSKTAFNRSFSALTGMTPGQYRSHKKRDLAS